MSKSSGAKKLSSTEDSYMNPTEIQQQKQSGYTFWVKIFD